MADFRTDSECGSSEVPRRIGDSNRCHRCWIMTIILCFVVLALTFCPLLISPVMSDDFPNVVILDSYHHGYNWSDKEIVGFLERMREAYPLFDPPIEHLDAKRHPGEDNLISIRKRLQDKYGGQKVDLIVALDNPALELLICYRDELFPGIPIVFGGINDFNPTMLLGHRDITGVAEIMDDEKTLEMVLKFHPNTKEVLVIHDYTSSGLAVRKEFEKLLPKFSERVRFRFLPPNTLEETINEVRSLSPDSLGIILSYTTDRIGHSLSLAESTRMLTSSSPAPIYALHETRLGHGIVGGQLVGGVEHGRRVADVALRVLSGEQPGSIAIDMSIGSRPMFDHSQLERFRIALNALPPGSIVINKTESIFERYRTLTIGTITLMAVLSVLVIGLAASLLRLRSAQKELVKSEAKFRRFVETANEGLWAMDGDYRTTFVNRRMAEMLGYPIEEILGKPVDYFFFNEDLAEHRNNMELRRKGEDQSYERRFRRKDGSSIWTIVSATALKDDRGTFAGSFAMFTDITERKVAEEKLIESEERHRTLFTTMSLGVVYQDSQGRIMSANPAAVRILGRDLQEMQGFTSHDSGWLAIREDGTEFPGDEHPSMLALRTGKDISSTIMGVFNPKKEERLWLSVSAVPLYLPGNESPFQVYTVFEDITDKKRAQEILQDKEQQYRLLAENTLDIIWQMDLDLRCTYVNQAILRATGYTTDEWVGSELSEHCDEENFLKMAEAASSLVSKGVEDPGIIVEALMLNRYKQYFWAEIHARALFDDNGHPIGFQGVTRDITERKNAEEKLKISEDRFRTLLETAPSGFWSTDPVGQNTYVSPYWTKLTGISQEDARRDGWASGLHPDDKDKIFRGWLDSAIKDEAYSTEFRFIHPDGRCVWVLCQALAVKTDDGSVSEWLGTITDITDRKTAEEALRDSEARYRGIFEGAAEGILVAEHQTMRIRYANQAMCHMLGYTEDELMSLFVPNIHPKDQLDDVIGNFLLLARGLTAKVEAIPVQRKDATIFYADIAATLMEIDGVMCNVGFFWDITERIRAEEALRESERRYRAVVDNLQIGISLINRKMEIVAINPFFGAFYPDVVPGAGQKCYAMYNDPPRSSPCSYCPCELTFQDGQVHENETETPAGNKIRNYRIISCPVKDEHDDVQLVIELVEDTTEKRSLYSQLLQAQKMEAVGTLAGGVAHDFNNLLQAVLGYSELMLDRKKEGESDYSDLQKIYEAGKRGADLVKSLLTFSRKVETKYVPVDLNQEVTSVRDLMFRTIPRTMNIDLHLKGNLKSIKADPSQIGQILLNLGVNARDAMPDGGTLSIETANVQLDEEYCSVYIDTTPGQYVLLTVSDTGQGMDQETLSHIFEPFYTTKETGKGTGLGLATVYGIVKQHSGHITCHSEPAKGTTFRIYFPVIEIERDSEAATRETPILGGTETILLVDDDQAVRDLGTNFLSRFGYNAITANDGKEALEIYQREGERISLVILDLSMPEMDGKKCLKGILRVNPNAKVIMASGYSDAGLGSGATAGAKGFVQKPYDMRQLLTAIRDILDSD